MSSPSAQTLTPQQVYQILDSLPENLSSEARSVALRHILKKYDSATEMAQESLLGQAVWQHAQAQQSLKQLISKHQKMLQELELSLGQLNQKLAECEDSYQEQRRSFEEKQKQLSQVLIYLGEDFRETEMQSSSPMRQSNPRMLSTRATPQHGSIIP
jgi:septal ring factor EnvC (AmiA/AmiB activator)